jgi:uncharacterized phiE125 gp8 family phage protein
MKTRGFSITKENVDGTSIVTGVLSLDIVKDYLEIDLEDTGHDDLIEILLEAAIDAVEKYTCLTLWGERIITARWEELTSSMIPYSPVKEVISIQDKDGTDLTSCKTEGQIGGAMRIVADRDSPTVIKYRAGYTELPYLLQQAILKHIVDGFEFRTGLDLSSSAAVKSLPNNWKSVARFYRQIPWSA